MQASSAQLRLVKQTFATLVGKLNEHHHLLSPGPNELAFTTILFQVDDMAWYFSNKNGVVAMEESFGSLNKPKLVASSTVTTDLGTMVKVCRGAMSFPAAYLSGKVKFTGDQKLLKAIGVPLKDALEVVRSCKNDAANGGQDTLPGPQLDATYTPYPAGRLRARIVEAFASNFTYNVNDLDSLQQSVQAPKDGVVQYKIEVRIDGTDEVWLVAHRYSHFVQLRADLVDQGYRDIPALSSKSALFNSFRRVLHSRIINLGFFINECLDLVRPENETLGAFLAKPLARAGSAQSVTDSTAGSGLTTSTEHAAATHSNEGPFHPFNLDEDLEEDGPEHGGYPNAALEHAWGKPITWAHQSLHQSRYLIQELNTQKRAVDAVLKGSAHHSQGLLDRVFTSIQGWALFVVTGLISFYYFDVALPGHETSMPQLRAELTVKLVLALLLFVPRTRRATVLYCLGWLLAFSAGSTVLGAVQRLISRYLEHRTMYDSHLRWTAVPYNVLVAPEQFRSPPSLMRMVWRGLSTASSRLVVVAMESFGGTLRRLVLSPVSLYGMGTGLHWHYADPIGLLTSLRQLVDWTACAVGGSVVALAVVLRSPGLSRALWIYILGVSLIAVYASLQAACVVLRVRASTSETLFARLDAVLAPFVVAQIGQLRSVFVKFAQYFGGRSDIVSPIWTDLLSQLHDSCPPSSEVYVRETIERELGEVMRNINNSSGQPAAKFSLEDVFESFDRSPIASASIGQVHTATLKHAVIMQILHAQQQAAVREAHNNQQQGRGIEPSTPTALSSSRTTGESDDGDNQENESGGGEERGSGQFTSPLPAPPILSSTSTPSAPATAGATPAHEYHSPCRGQGQQDDGSSIPDLSWYEAATDPAFTCASTSEASHLVSVAVKVQHEGVEPLMVADMQIVLVLVRWAAKIDSRWQTMQQVMRSWDLTMRAELDYRQEAANLREMRDIMHKSGLGAATPYPLPGLATPRVLVMTRLFGHKVTDKTALALHNVDRQALLTRIAHCSAHQLLVAGVFNADPHAGNILFCLSTTSALKPRSGSAVKEDCEQSTSVSDSGTAEDDDSASLSYEPPTPVATVPAPGHQAGNAAIDSDGAAADRFVPQRSSFSSDKSGPGTAAAANGRAADPRLIYEATPGKTVTFGRTPSTQGSDVVRSSPSPSLSSTQGTGAAPAAAAAPTADHTARRIIYDATPAAKGVGFAANVTMHSAESYGIFTPGTEIPASAGPTAGTAGRRTPAATKGAGSTPYVRSRTGPNDSFLSPASSARSLRSIGSFLQIDREPEPPLIIPGLLDFGMTVRLEPERRKAYCRMIAALCDGDMKAAAAELRAVGYASNQSHRAPERDAEFFEHMFRDANSRGVSRQEAAEFTQKRARQRDEDIAAGTREKGGRSIATVPDDFLFLSRLMGLLRGLSAELDCSVPILYILGLHARLGLQEEDADGDRDA